jgi:hypothetical protein
MSQLIAQRAQQKARARARDEERLRRGEISALELQRENSPFRKLRRDRISFIPASRSEADRFLVV